MGSLILAGQTLTVALLNQYYSQSDTTPTTVTGTGPATLSTVYAIPANEPLVGSAYRMECGGSGIWGSTQQVLTFSLYLQGTLICANVSVAAAAFNASAGFRWRVTADWVCSATGASGSFYGGYHGTLSNTANPELPGTAADNTVPVADANSAAVTIDTTSVMFAKLSAGFASNTGSPTITCRRTIFAKVA